jgi:branched-chain amino acid transport system substrate-binding protein
MKKFPTICAIILFAAFPARAADIVWATAGPYTGSVAAWGLSQKAGIEQAVADINAKGGIGSRKIVLKAYDDACDPKQAVAIANRVVSEGIRYILYGTCSANSLAASKTYIDEGVLVMNTMASNPKVTDEGGPLIFRSMYRDDRNAVVLADDILKHYAGKKLAIINDRSAYGLGIAEYVRDRLNKAGFKEILFDSYDPANHDYSVLVTRLKSLGTEVLFIGGYPVETGAIARQLREAGSTAQIYRGDLSEPDFWKIAGLAGEGALFAFTSDPRKEPKAAKVLDELQKSGVVVDGYTLYGYAAAQVLAEAMAQAGDDPVKVAAAIHKGKFDTTLGTWSYDEKGDVENIRQLMFLWHDGNYMEATR